jgi:hypothetical protein
MFYGLSFSFGIFSFAACLAHSEGGKARHAFLALTGRERMAGRKGHASEGALSLEREEEGFRAPDSEGDNACNRNKIGDGQLFGIRTVRLSKTIQKNHFYQTVQIVVVVYW